MHEEHLLVDIHEGELGYPFRIDHIIKWIDTIDIKSEEEGIFGILGEDNALRSRDGRYVKSSRKDGVKLHLPLYINQNNIKGKRNKRGAIII